ncbi:MAG: hypothetical protein BWY67_01962 [Bacteroidetes bacterium ADurb.Bin397]|nr:MAG: hypothetical protein BWY67_01962 [Bacteroidetes bacterium ADurb.Bin397]
MTRMHMSFNTKFIPVIELFENVFAGIFWLKTKRITTKIDGVFSLVLRKKKLIPKIFQDIFLIHFQGKFFIKLVLHGLIIKMQIKTTYFQETITNIRRNGILLPVMPE